MAHIKVEKLLNLLCHYHDSWNILCYSTNIYLMSPDSFFIQILPLGILGIPSTNGVPGGFYCHHSAPRLPFWVVQPTTASGSCYESFLFQINTELFSWLANLETEQRSTRVIEAVQGYTSSRPIAQLFVYVKPSFSVRCLAGNKHMMLPVAFPLIAMPPTP